MLRALPPQMIQTLNNCLKDPAYLHLRKRLLQFTVPLYLVKQTVSQQLVLQSVLFVYGCAHPSPTLGRYLSETFELGQVLVPDL